MKIQKKWLYILLAAAGVFGVVTICCPVSKM